MDLNERIVELKKRLSSVKNLTENSAGGDLKFFIFDYDPKDELRVRKETKNLIKNNPFIREFDLFEMMLDIIKNSGYLDHIFSLEKDEPKSFLLSEVFQPILALEETSNPVLKAFKESVIDNGQTIILITGVGKAYPIIRSHTILNNLQTIFKQNPVVMMYPGHYEVKKKMTLRLFDRLDDDNYYRAFALVGRGEE